MDIIRKNYILILLFSIVKRFPLFIHVHRIIDNTFSNFFFGLLFFVPAILFYCYLRIRFFVIRNIIKGIALVMVVRNEGPYLDEIIKYYYIIGFDKIIIYDNQSTDNTKEIAKRYKRYNVTEYRTIKGLFGAGRQKDIYNDALNKYGFKYKYLCFFDADEFLKISGTNTFEEVDDLFKKYKKTKIGSLAVNMYLFGTSGHIHKPDGLVLENYVYRKERNYQANYHTKVIADTSKILCMHNPHTPFLRNGYKFLLCNGESGGWTKSNVVDDSQLILYHYYTRSRDEYEEKRSKGDVRLARNKKGALRELHSLSELDSNNIIDDYMIKYIDKIKNISF